MTYCEDCGCKVFSGKCTNCHEELFILDQYDELDMDYPDGGSQFMNRVMSFNIKPPTNANN